MWHPFQRWAVKAIARRGTRKQRRRHRPRTIEALEARQLLAAVDGAVRFNEIMYHPAGGNDELQWIELYNPAAIPIDISGWQLDGGVKLTFPSAAPNRPASEGTILGSRQYLVVAANPAALAAATGLSGIKGPFTNKLAHSGEKIKLLNNAGRLMDEVDYGDSGKWPLGADGSGVSLAKTAPELDSRNPASWTTSAEVGGTPAAQNFVDPNTPPTVTPLITSGTTWKYYAGGDLGTVWREPGYSDAAWPSGAANLYYGSAGAPAGSGTVTATITADNVFGFYVGNADGSNLRLIGSGSNWQAPQPYNFSVSANEYLYVAAWDQGGAQMLIGEFVLPDGTRLGTNTTDWQYVVGPTNGINIGGTTPPTISAVQTVVAGANAASSWRAPQAQAVRTTSPWGSSVGGAFTDAAQYIWADTLSISGNNSITDTNSTYALFRTTKAVMPSLGKTLLPSGASTYYFRKTFTYAGNLSRTQLALDTVLDDGAVVYLNGHEVYRQNMPSGDVSSSTPASGEVANPPGYVYQIPLPTTYLLTGTNVLQVEVHTATVPDEDMLFGAALTATVSPATAVAPSLALNEISAGQPADFWVELVNHGTSPLSLGGYVIVNSAGGEYVLPAQELAPGGYLALTQAQLGFPTASGNRLFLYTPDRHGLIDAVKVDDVLRGRAPAGKGDWLFPTAATPGTANEFQVSSDIVINEIMYHHRAMWVGPAFPPQDSPEEWIELYNRGTTEVDLSGWQFDDALHYTFPAGTTLAPNSYLVISNGADALRAKYPGITVLGDFTDTLSNASGRVVLEDLNRNAVDEVAYYDGGAWPEFADGGGSSMELRNPNADNSKPEAWAASDESGRTAWKTYSYTVYAQASVAGPDDQWHELVLGLLSDGVVLLDDISVLDTAAPGIQLIQNRGFESGSDHWRLLGNHRHSSVIVDPANSANHVLKLVATGATEHMHNHVESTLLNNTAIVTGRTYQISFKAKWISGSNQLNTRLYFDRAARTTLIDQPALSGTPGTRNSTYVANVGPSYRDLKQNLAVPAPNTPVTISVLAEDPDGVASLALKYSVAGGGWQNVTMTAQGGGLYQGTIAGQAASSIVQFYVDGVDTLGTHSFYPAGGANSRALYKVNDGLAATNGLHNFRIIVTPADAAFLEDHTQVMSNDAVGCTVIYNESQIFYNVGVRTKASERGRMQDARVGFFIFFNPEQPFRGIYQSVGIDRSGGIGTGQQEMLIKQVIGHAGGVSAEYNDLIQVITPSQVNTGAAELQLAHFSDLFLDSQFEDGSDGELFKLDYIYYPLTTNTGTPEGLKYAEPDSVTYVNVRDIGGTGNLLANSSFESWAGNVPGNWSVVAGASNITYVSTVYDGSRALKITGNAAGTLTALTQSLNLTAGTLNALQPSTPYCLLFRVRHDGTAPAAGNLTFSLVDGAGAIVKDDLNADNLFTLAATEITAGYTNYMATFRTPAALPTSLKLKIGLSTALTSGRSVYIDGVSMSDLANDKEQYRYMYILRNNRVEDDFTPFIQFLKFWNTTGQAFTDHVNEYIDVDVWLRSFAFAALSGAVDNFAQGDQHNGRFYVRPSDGKVLYLPQDMDFMGGSSLPVTNSPDLQKLLVVPAYARAYYGHLYDILNTAYNATYMAYWTGSYGSLLPGQDFAGHQTYMSQRHDYVLGVVNNWAGSKAATPFTITTNGGNNFSINDVKTTLTGNGWIDVHQIRLAGSNLMLPVTWTANKVWQVTVPLAVGANVLGFQAYDYQGRLVGSDSITVTSTAAPAPLQQSLRITEINYNPLPPTTAELAVNPSFTNDDFEFLELTNTSATTTLNLRGVQFAAGVTFDFTASSAILDLAPGERILLARNPSGLQARYGADLTAKIAGVFAGGLNNGGEQLTLLDGNSVTIADFTYGDSGDWPGRTDGKGSTLEPLNTAGDYNDPSNWRASIEFGGTPGEAGAGPDVVVNEVLAHTDQPLVDTVELYNTTAEAIDIGGWWLSDSSADYFKFQIPAGTIIAGHGYLVFRQGHYVGDTMEFAADEFGGGLKGFGLNSAQGDDVWLVQADASGNIQRFADQAVFGASANGESWGRWRDEQGRFHFSPLERRTLDAPNSANSTDGNGPRAGQVIISEVMYAPAPLTTTEITAGFTTAEEMEFIEIFNSTVSTVDLGRWRLDNAVIYDFAVGTVLAAGKSLVIVPFDPSNATMLAAFRLRHGNTTATVVGPYTGRLANEGERLRLQRPDDPPVDDPTWYPPLLADEVTFGAAWGGGNADGKSLHRIAVDAWGNDMSSWAAAANSPGTARIVAGRQVFYNNSAFDGRDTAANPQDDQAIATDKRPLLPGRSATFENYTSYTLGINGILVDVASPTGTINASDFEFRVGNDGNPDAWPLLATAPTVTLRTGSGVGGATRVMLAWPDGTIQNQWLRVKVLASARTGLAGSNVFYFGNAIGETGDHSISPGANADVDEADMEAALVNKTLTTPVTITDPHDFNRDRRVNATDYLAARENSRQGAAALQLINLTNTSQATAAAAQAAAGASHAVESVAAASEELGSTLSVQGLAPGTGYATPEVQEQPANLSRRQVRNLTRTAVPERTPASAPSPVPLQERVASACDIALCHLVKGPRRDVVPLPESQFAAGKFLPLAPARRRPVTGGAIVNATDLVLWTQTHW